MSRTWRKRKSLFSYLLIIVQQHMGPGNKKKKEIGINVKYKVKVSSGFHVKRGSSVDINNLDTHVHST